MRYKHGDKIPLILRRLPVNFRRFGQLLAATTVTAVAVSGAPAFAAELSLIHI